MKAIIGGKKYDTDTAHLLGTYESGHGRSDFEFVLEELFRTKRGSYFLFGEGGAKTRYSTPGPGNCTGGGWKIIPLTREEALSWAEDHMEPDKIEEEFGDLVAEA